MKLIKLMNLIHNLFKLTCENCQHRYGYEECDINIGVWHDKDYCKCFIDSKEVEDE